MTHRICTAAKITDIHQPCLTSVLVENPPNSIQAGTTGVAMGDIKELTVAESIRIIGPTGFAPREAQISRIIGRTRAETPELSSTWVNR